MEQCISSAQWVWFFPRTMTSFSCKSNKSYLLCSQQEKNLSEPGEEELGIGLSFLSPTPTHFLTSPLPSRHHAPLYLLLHLGVSVKLQSRVSFVVSSKIQMLAQSNALSTGINRKYKQRACQVHERFIRESVSCSAHVRAWDDRWRPVRDLQTGCSPDNLQVIAVPRVEWTLSPLNLAIDPLVSFQFLKPYFTSLLQFRAICIFSH